MPAPDYLSDACKATWVDRCKERFDACQVSCVLPEGHSGDHLGYLLPKVQGMPTRWRSGETPRCRYVDDFHNRCALPEGHESPHRAIMPSGGTNTFFTGRQLKLQFADPRLPRFPGLEVLFEESKR